MFPTLRVLLCWQSTSEHGKCSQYFTMVCQARKILQTEALTLQFEPYRQILYPAWSTAEVNRTGWGVQYYSGWIKESWGKAWYWVNNAWKREKKHLSLYLAEHRKVWGQVFFPCLAGLCTPALESSGLYLLRRNLKGRCVYNRRICTQLYTWVSKLRVAEVSVRTQCWGKFVSGKEILLRV